MEELELCKRVDIEFILDEVNKFLRKQTTIPEGSGILATYPKIEKKQTSLQIQFIEDVNLDGPDTRAVKISSDMYIIHLSQNTCSWKYFTYVKEVIARKVEKLYYKPLRVEPFDDYIKNFNPGSTCKTLQEYIEQENLSLEDFMQRVIEDLSERLEYQGKNLRKDEYLHSVKYVLAQNSAKLGLPKEFFLLAHEMMFLDYAEFEELEEWLPFPVYEKVQKKYEGLRNRFFELFQQCLNLIENHNMKKWFIELARSAYEHKQYVNLDEPHLSYDVHTLTGFDQQLKKLGIRV